MTISAKDIIDTLKTLDKKDLEQIRNRCLFLIQNSSSKYKVETLAEKDWLLEGFKVQAEKLAMYVPPDFQIKNSRSHDSFSSKSCTVRDLIEKNTPSLTTYIQFLKLGEICAAVLAKHIQLWDSDEWPLSFEAMLRLVHKVPEVMDRAFPGYLADGMLAFLVNHQFPKD